MNLKKRKEAFIGGLAGGKRGEKFNYIIILQNKIKFKKTNSLTLSIS